jgi:hypothetical protein
MSKTWPPCGAEGAHFPYWGLCQFSERTGRNGQIVQGFLERVIDGVERRRFMQPQIGIDGHHARVSRHGSQIMVEEEGLAYTPGRE